MNSVTRQTKNNTNGWANLAGLLRFFQIGVLSTMMFKFASIGQAQGNLVNLYDWNNDTAHVAPGHAGQFISIYNNTSAGFFGGFTTNPFSLVAASPTLSDEFSTTPGATYEISFTMQNLNGFNGFASESFGNETLNFDLPVVLQNGGESYADTPVNEEFTAVATSTLTTMSFECYLDPNGGAASLGNLTVTELPVTDAPEESTGSLLFYGGCICLLAKEFGRLVRKHKLAVKRIN